MQEQQNGTLERARQCFQQTPPDQGLYSFQNEHDACGVGLVANLDNKSSHQIIEKGITILKRLMHRGAAGGDPETGDGAGILCALPDAFFRKILPVPPAASSRKIRNTGRAIWKSASNRWKRLPIR